jgi:cell wall-associated NlpC family hydrolase
MKFDDFFSSSDLKEYICLANLNLYTNSECSSLATQAAVNRRLKVFPDRAVQHSLEVCLREDDYPGWLKIEDSIYLKPSVETYQPVPVSEDEIRARLPKAIAFAYQSMEVSNYYLWGGTVAPNYDCSGLMQAAFSSVGIWLPRDAYQQQAFLESISKDDLLPGDLVFFSKADNRITHVGLYLGQGRYIHSSGREIGRDGIGIDELSADGDAVSCAYYQQFHSCGRIVQSYQSTGQKWSRRIE